MSEVNSPKEQPNQPSETKPGKLALAAVLSTFALSAIGGGFGGYKIIGQGDASSDRRDRAAQIDRDVKCAGIVERFAKRGSTVAIVHPSELTNQEQTDCGVDWVYSAVTASGSASSVNALVGKIVGTEVELPSITKLQANEHQEYATEVSTEDPGDKALGIVFGGFVGGVAWVLGASAIIGLTEQRHKQDAPPPEVSQSAAP